MSQNSEWHQALHPQHAFWDNTGTRWVLPGHKMIDMNLEERQVSKQRHANTQGQVWLSLCGVSWCAQGFVWDRQVSLAGMGFDSKCNLAPPTILLGLLLCPWTWGIFFGGHSHVDSCLAVSCNFGVLTEDERTSFYSAIKDRQRQAKR